MNRVCSIFSHLLQLFSRVEFEAAVKQHKAERHARGFTCWGQFVAMLFCQLGRAHSLREICQGLAASEGKLKHLGVPTAPSRSTLAYANQHRPWQLYQTVFLELLARCQELAHNGRRKFRFKNKLLSLDATVIDLCAALYDWAKFRRTKGAIKLHLLLDHDGYLPRFAVITDGKTHELKVARKLRWEPGTIVVFDRGYIDYQWFMELTRQLWRFSLDEADPALLNAAQEIVSPGSVVWDIVANVGLFTFAAAALAGKEGTIIAVEPDLWLVSLLSKSARMQPSDHAPVTVVPAAILDEVGITTLHITSRGRCSNFVSGGGSANRGAVLTTQTAMAVTLDWLAQYLPLPDVLKIDVEGLEAKVLRGAKTVLKKRPKILCEVYSENRQEVAAILGPHGYRFHDSEDPQFKPVELPAYNTLALAGNTVAILAGRRALGV